MPPNELGELKVQLRETAGQGFYPPWFIILAMPSHVVDKKDHTKRLVVDYRPLNEVTVKNKCPFASHRYPFDQLAGAKVLSKTLSQS